MRVGCPGICTRKALYQVGACGCRCRPQTKCTIHVYPRPGLTSMRNDLARRVERSGIDVARLQADDGGATDHRKGVGAHSSLIVYGNLDYALSPKPQHPKRLEERGVGFFSHNHRDGRRPEQAISLHVPPYVL